MSRSSGPGGQSKADWLQAALEQPELADLLAHRVLERLDVRSLQALLNTSRACRQLVATGQGVLEALAQAQLPGMLPTRQPLSQAQLREELSAAASLLASVRKGSQPTVAHTQLLQQRESTLQMLPQHSLLSPSGSAAAWVFERSDREQAGPAPRYILTPAGRSPHASPWLIPLQALSLMTHQLPATKGWSPSGRYLACFVNLRQHCVTGSDTVARVYDSEQACWLPALPCGGSAELEPFDDVKWTACGSLFAAAVRVGPDFMDCQICIGSLGTPEQPAFMQALPVSGSFCGFEWLRECPRLVVRSYQLGALAIVEPSAASFVLQPDWVTLSFGEEDGEAEVGDTCVGMLPAQHVAALQVASSLQYEDRLVCRFIVLDSHLQPCSSRRTVVANAEYMDLIELSGACSVVASQHSLAMQLGTLGTWLYQLKGSDTIGKLVCTMPDLEYISLSPAGHFLAGSVGSDVCVLDGRTGASLMRLGPASYWPGKQAGPIRFVDQVHVMFAGPRHSQLLITARVGYGAMSDEGRQWVDYDKNARLWSALQL